MPTLVAILSADHFSTYLQWTGQDEELAKRLYTFNVKLSGALYGPLHMFEVALRNVMDTKLCTEKGANWLDDNAVLVTHYQRQCIVKARATLLQEGKQATHGQMVAELNFGFWSSLFGRQSHHLWQSLRPIFQAKGIQRPAIAAHLKAFRQLRNRVAHYEPILGLPLAQRYADITTMTGWLSASAAGWIQQNSTWNEVYPAVPILEVDARTGATRISPGAVPFLPA